MPWTMFVEGSSDEAFLSGVLRHLEITNVETERINGGVGKLGSVARQMQRRSLRGNRISVILDADADFEKRRGEYETERVRHELPIDRFFLLPNHRDTGCLETLLEQIAVSGHRVVYECFDAYERCLRRHSDAYRVPNLKARIYAYCEALDIETSSPSRDYGNTSYWDLDAVALEPLRAFLTGLHATGA